MYLSIYTSKKKKKFRNRPMLLETLKTAHFAEKYIYIRVYIPIFALPYPKSR